MSPFCKTKMSPQTQEGGGKCGADDDSKRSREARSDERTGKEKIDLQGGRRSVGAVKKADNTINEKVP